MSDYGYEVFWDILNSYDSNLPQSRPRVYVVAIHDGCVDGRKFKFPSKLGHRVSLTKCLDPPGLPADTPTSLSDRAQKMVDASLKEAIEDYGINVDKVPIATDIDASESFGQWTADYLPCITATRGKSGGFYINTRGRRTTVTELMRAQGMVPSRVNRWDRYMSRGDMGHALGNAMSVAVLDRVLPRALWSAGILKFKPEDLHANPKWKPWFLF